MKKLLFIPILLLLSSVFINNRLYHRPVLINNSDTGFLRYIDTNIVVYSVDNAPLRYYQYAGLLTDGLHFITSKKGKRQFTVMQMPPSVNRNKFRDSTMMISFNLNSLSLWSKTIPPVDRRLLKNMPAAIDTNNLVYDQYNDTLRFPQYFSLLFNGKAYFYGKNHINRFSEYTMSVMPGILRNAADSSKKLAEIFLLFSQADKVLVIKSKRQVYLQRKDKTFLTFPCNLGMDPVGDKSREGDRKTPEGIYKLIGKTTQTKYYKGYLILYPDSVHILAAKSKGVQPGGGVMFHGTSAERAKRKDWTNGCIAISNAHMDSLFKYVLPQTPVEIRK